MSTKYPRVKRKNALRRARRYLNSIGINKSSISKMSDRSAVGLHRIMVRHKTKYSHMKRAMKEYDEMKKSKKK